MDHSDPDLHCSFWEEADDTRNPRDQKDKGTRGSQNFLVQWAAAQAEVEAARNYVGEIDSVAADFAVAAADAVDAVDAAAAGSDDFAAWMRAEVGKPATERDRPLGCTLRCRP